MPLVFKEQQRDQSAEQAGITPDAVPCEPHRWVERKGLSDYGDSLAGGS